MLPQNFIELLLSFEKGDWTGCNAYMSSKYRDCTKEKLLFDLIYKRRSNLRHKSLLRSSLLSMLFPDQNKAAFNNLLARVRRSIEDYIIQSQLFSKDYSWERSMILAKYYKGKGLNDLFFAESKSQLKQIDVMSEYDLALSQKQFRTNYEVAYSELRLDDQLEYLNKSLQSVTSHSLEMKMLLEIELINQNILFSQNTEAKNEESELLLYLERLKELVKDQDDASYQFLKNTLITNNSGIKGDLAQISLIYMVNYVRYKMKKGDHTASSELLDLYIYGIDSGILLNQGMLSEIRFLNIIEIKSYLDQTIDHSLFLYKWLPVTETSDRDIVERIGLAYLNFGKGDYGTALDQLDLEDSVYDNLNLELRSRWLRICATYAHDPNHLHYDTLLKTQEQYFRRKKEVIGQANYEGSINLLKTIRMMWEGRSSVYIKEKIGKYEYLNCRMWITQELKKARTR